MRTFWLVRLCCCSPRAARSAHRAAGKPQDRALCRRRVLRRGGAYEQITARAVGAVDPKAPDNAIIQDIALAPRNADGLVEYATDMMIVRPLASGARLRTPCCSTCSIAATRRRSTPSIWAIRATASCSASGITVVMAGWQPGPLGGERLTISVPVGAQSGRLVHHRPGADGISIRCETAPRCRSTRAARPITRRSRSIRPRRADPAGA